MSEITQEQKLKEVETFIENVTIALDAITKAAKSIPESLSKEPKKVTLKPLYIAGEYLVVLLSAVGASYAEATGHKEYAEYLLAEGLTSSNNLKNMGAVTTIEI
jgi:hypothetical protein